MSSAENERGGFVERYIEYASEFTDAPEIFHRHIAYSILSTILARKVFLWQGHKRVFPNLWLIVIAPSSFYRKSFSLSISDDILRGVTELTGDRYILPREFSREKLVSILSETPQGLLIAYEFRTFMALMSRDYMAGTQSMITELFDCPTIYDREIGGKKFEIKDACINILAATTIDWMKTSIKDVDMASGFLPRFLVVPFAGQKERIMAWQEPHDINKQDKLVRHLANLSTLRGPCSIGPEARSYYVDWYVRFEKEWSRPGILSPFYARIQEYAKKLAILTCIDRSGALIIGRDHMESACHIADSYARWITSIVEEDLTYMDKPQRKVIEVLKAAGEDGIGREELIRKTRLLADQLNKILATFLESRQIKRTGELFKNSQGAERERITYFWANGDYTD